MKSDEARQLPVDEIQARLEDAFEELENLRFQNSTHQLDNPLRIREVRKDIARYKTILREYEKGIREPQS